MNDLKKLEKFDNWMRSKIQSVHYSNNAKMFNAYQIILKKSL
jgi:hypothetical protein